MADCCDVFKMVDEGDSFQSWNGLRGPYFVPHLSADGVLSWTNTGNLPNPAPVDISGPPGVSVELRGPVPSVQDLPATASSSELWLVGTASPYDGWFYNGVQWENAGPVAVGPPGPAGEDGVSPEIEIETITGGHTVTITDAEHPTGQSFNVMDGTDGSPGQPGTPGAPGAAAGFGTPTATVDANVGTPSVEISASGPDTAKVFSFAFHNLKGEPGSGGGGPDPYTSDPADLAAAASPGSASQYSRGDHVHKLPTAAQIGAYVKPSGGIPASDLASGVIPSVPSAYTSNPEMDGTASPGSSTAWAKGDHVHPHDTSKADTGLGITGATVGKVPVISAVDGNGVPTAFDFGDGGDVTADMLGIVINGNSTPVGAAVGQYVIVKNSTISGITDGLYTAAKDIPASTAIDATYLTGVSGGGLNGLLLRSQWVSIWQNASPTSNFSGQTIPFNASAYSFFRIDFILAGGAEFSTFVRKGARFGVDTFYGGKAFIRLTNTDGITNSGVTFADAYAYPTYNNPTAAIADNSVCIPIAIYGVV